MNTGIKQLAQQANSKGRQALFLKVTRFAYASGKTKRRLARLALEATDSQGNPLHVQGQSLAIKHP